MGIRTECRENDYDYEESLLDDLRKKGSRKNLSGEDKNNIINEIKRLKKAIDYNNNLTKGTNYLLKTLVGLLQEQNKKL